MLLDRLKSKYGPNTEKCTDLPTCISSEKTAEVLGIFLQYLQVLEILVKMLLNSGIKHIIECYSLTNSTKNTVFMLLAPEEPR